MVTHLKYEELIAVHPRNLVHRAASKLFHLPILFYTMSLYFLGYEVCLFFLRFCLCFALVVVVFLFTS